ncbi:TetR/AcrR family transcriptional regulator [Desulfobacter curvatus]|jgi:TetR/AcrR family transcriptional regulator|uniref:TetR/AcrR family transcriptional regulator n=1 Tax=Desulfobacter curvatus TaxID=2290 RepID=UPI00036C3A33|nr:TetR/AcrR family transcriptional regulator [Desulfobacter curvatus]
MSVQRARDPEATKKALLDAAEKEFLEKGFGKSAMSQIARRAGITKSLIHHYFGSKQGLWEEVKARRFEEYYQKQMEMFDQYDNSNRLELLRESVAVYFRFLKKNPQLIRILVWMYLERDQEMCLEKDKKLVEIGGAELRQAQRDGYIRQDIDPRFILFTFIGLCQHWFQDKEHFLSDFGSEGLPEDLDEAYLDAVSKIFLEGLLPR